MKMKIIIFLSVLILMLPAVAANDNTTLTGSDIETYYGSNTLYSVELKDSSSHTIENAQISMEVDGNNYIQNTTKEGVCQININLTSNIYIISSKFLGNDLYSPSNTTNIIKILPTIESDDLVKVYKNNTQFYVKLLDSNGTSLSNTAAIFNVNGGTYNKTTNSNGIAKLNINLGPGNYTITTLNTLTHEKVSNTIVVLAHVVDNSDLVKYYRNASQYVVKIINTDGSPVGSGKNVSFNINGVFYTRTTNNNSQARLNINLPPGTYIITAQYENTNSSNTIKVLPVLYAINLTKAYGVADSFKVKLTDEIGNYLSGEKITFNINGILYTKTTNSLGIAKLNINLPIGSYIITSSYNGLNIANTVKVLESVYVNDNIQSVINKNNDKAIILTKSEYNESIEINNSILLTTNTKTVLNGNVKISSDDVVVKNLIINTVRVDAITINNSKNIVIENNTITQSLNESNLNKYESCEVLLKGNGIGIVNSQGVYVNNKISYFYNGIYLKNSSDNKIIANNITRNNFGIEFDSGVANTLILNNKINSQYGLVTYEVVEGPYGYGVSVRHSGVNITMKYNEINNNYMGIFLDAKNCEGIVIVSNEISNSTIEGFTANENYTPASGAKLIVENNALYANAKGPSLMILGEVSANPAGIYGPGEWNDDLKLRLGSNWYGTTVYTKWGNSTGPGTICPRIKTTLISCNLTSLGNGKYSVRFYDNNTPATKLPDFKYYFTLNYYTDKEFELVASVHKGESTIEFPIENFYSTGNIIEGSAGSLNDPDRPFPITYTYNVGDGEF